MQAASPDCFRTTRTIKLVAFYAVLASEFESLAERAQCVRRFQRDDYYCVDRYMFRHCDPSMEVEFDVGFRDVTTYRIRISFVSITIISDRLSLPNPRYLYEYARRACKVPSTRHIFWLVVRRTEILGR